MGPFIIVLDPIRHQDLLKQARVDPLIKRPFEPGDRVVQCAHCKIVFLEETWNEVKGRAFNHGTATLPEIEIERVTFHRETAPAADEIHANGNEPATNIFDPISGQVGYDQPGVDASSGEPRRFATSNGSQRRPTSSPAQPKALRLREIPFQLREIPFALREVGSY